MKTEPLKFKNEDDYNNYLKTIHEHLWYIVIENTTEKEDGTFEVSIDVSYL